MTDSISPTDPKIVELTSGLVTYVKTLITRSTKAVRDALKDAHTVIWLDEVLEGGTPTDSRLLLEIEYPEVIDRPELPAILHGRATDATNPWGDEPALIDENLDASSPQPSTEASDAHQSWLPLWRQWAAAERAGQWYRRFEQLAREATQRSDSHELVLGVGLMTVPAGKSWVVRRHLLVSEVMLETDPATDAVRLVLPLHHRLRPEHRQFLTTTDGLASADRTPGQKFDFDLPDVHPLSADVASWLEDWRGRCWHRPLRVEATRWSAPRSDDGAMLALAPAIFLRPRDRSRLADCYERIASTLSGPDAAAPLGLAQLVVSLEPEERLRWLNHHTDGAPPVGGADPLLPLPSNQQQRQVLERLSTDTAVVVQGPPGTGKTHTIANLICALLAEGQRVLITSEKGQALRVLRDKLPPAVRHMCVVLSGLQRSGADELDRSITALSELTASTNLNQVRREIQQLAQERSRLQEQLQRATANLLRVRGEEYATHPEAGGRYAGTLRDIITGIRADQPRYQWIGTLPDEAPEQSPLTNKEALELLELSRTATPARAARADQQLPTQDVPASAQIAAKMACINDAAALLGPERESGKPLMSLNDSVLAQLQRHVDQATDALSHAGLPSTLADWEHQDWRLKAAEDLLARRNRAYWSTLFTDAAAVDSHEQALASFAGRDVEVDALPGDGVNPSRLLGQAKRLRKYLSHGGRFRRLWPAQAQQSATELLDVCTVDGAPPSTVSDLLAVIATLKTEIAVETALKAWATAGAPVVRGNLRSRIAQLRDINDGVAAVQQLIAARDGVEQVLRRHGIRYAIRTSTQWDLTVRVAHAGPLIAEANRAEQMLTTAIQELSWWRHQPNAAPEVANLVTALQDRNVSQYTAARSQLDQAGVEQEQERRCISLADRLALDHPSLLESLRRDPGLEDWNNRLRDFEAAWAWANAASYHRRLRDMSRDHDHEQTIDQTQQRLQSVTAELASNQALLHCLTRMTEHQRHALQSYRNAMTKFGKGSGRHKDRHLANARDALREATSAVPAWVMPLSVVADTIPHEHNAFDVIIVDEASQASLEALFLLWLAPRVIVVGDDRQCTPGVSPTAELSEFHAAADRYLPGLRRHMYDGLDPTSSLYDLLSARFPRVVHLSEHFRSMPEIIGWSSAQFYDKRLIPLRQFGADRLDPLKVVPVRDAIEEGRDASVKNRAEADAILEHVQKMVEDPAYRNRTIGIIVLQGSGQATLLERKLYERIDPADIKRFDIRVGQPPDFQGDQRDVILLSMVTVKARRALGSGRKEKQRFNVAASRARDQMWLFTSVTAANLNPADLRHSLLTYMLNPPPTLTMDPALDDVSRDRLEQPFESLLEQHVFLDLRQHGYAVIPQYQVDARRIDLVVVGDQGRLAIECETPSVPITREQLEGDIQRERELRRAGWEFFRVRDSEYLRDAQAALEPLWRRLDERGIEPRSLAPPPRTQPRWTPVPLPDENPHDEGDI